MVLYIARQAYKGIAAFVSIGLELTRDSSGSSTQQQDDNPDHELSIRPDFSYSEYRRFFSGDSVHECQSWVLAYRSGAIHYSHVVPFDEVTMTSLPAYDTAYAVSPSSWWVKPNKDLAKDKHSVNIIDKIDIEVMKTGDHVLIREELVKHYRNYLDHRAF